MRLMHRWSALSFVLALAFGSVLALPGCDDGYKTDGAVVKDAPPLNPEQKAVFDKAYKQAPAKPAAN